MNMDLQSNQKTKLDGTSAVTVLSALNTVTGGTKATKRRFAGGTIRCTSGSYAVTLDVYDGSTSTAYERWLITPTSGETIFLTDKDDGITLEEDESIRLTPGSDPNNTVHVVFDYRDVEA